MNYKLNNTQLPSFFEAVKYSQIEFPVRLSRDFVLSSLEIERLHYHNCFELGICRSGSGLCFAEDRIYSFKKGDIQIALPYQPHISKSDFDSPSGWDWIFFDHHELFEKAGIFGIDSENDTANSCISFSGVFNADEYPQITRLVTVLREEVLGDCPYKLRKCALYVNLLLIELIKMSDGNKRQDFSALSPDPVLPAIEYIDKIIFNGAVPLSVSELAKKCCINQTTFRRLFSSITGRTPKDYIQHKRIVLAEHLLVHTKKSILEISGLAGFESISGFNRSFLQKNGISPGAYRKKLCGADDEI